MSEAPIDVPAIAGWFTEDAAAPALLGTRCAACGTYFFPKEKTMCRRPGCGGTRLDEVPLSREGTLWSFTSAGYPPPEPFIAEKTPFEPFAIAAVALEREQLCVLGMVPAPWSCADLRVGMRMELVVDTLFVADGRRHLTWKWRPAGAAGAPTGAAGGAR